MYLFAAAMKYLIASISLILCFSAQAQNIKFGFKGNLGLSFGGNEFIFSDQSSYTSIPQISYGAEFPVYFQLAEVFYLRTGLGIQNKSFNVTLASVDQSNLPVKGLMRVGMNAYAIQLPLISAFQPKGRDDMMLELGMLFSRYAPLSQTTSGGFPSLLDNNEVLGVEINGPEPDFEVNYLPEAYVAFSYFLPSKNRVRQQLQLSYEYALRSGNTVVFDGEVLTNNGNFPFAASFQPNFSTLKLSYTVFPLW